MIALPQGFVCRWACLFACHRAFVCRWACLFARLVWGLPLFSSWASYLRLLAVLLGLAEGRALGLTVT